MPELIVMLRHDQEAQARGVAAFALGQIGVEADTGESLAEMVKALAEVLRKDADADVRGWVVWALLKLGPAARPALPALAAALAAKAGVP